jgi:hypothetical protein
MGRSEANARQDLIHSQRVAVTGRAAGPLPLARSNVPVVGEAVRGRVLVEEGKNSKRDKIDKGFHLVFSRESDGNF